MNSVTAHQTQLFKNEIHLEIRFIGTSRLSKRVAYLKVSPRWETVLLARFSSLLPHHDSMRLRTSSGCILFTSAWSTVSRAVLIPIWNSSPSAISTCTWKETSSAYAKDWKDLQLLTHWSSHTQKALKTSSFWMHGDRNIIHELSGQQFTNSWAVLPMQHGDSAHVCHLIQKRFLSHSRIGKDKKTVSSQRFACMFVTMESSI